MRVIHIVHGKCNPNDHNGISRVVYFLNKNEKIQGIHSEIWALVDDAKTKYEKVRDEYVTVECYPRVKTGLVKNQILEDLKKEKDTIDLIHFHMIWFYDKNVIAKELNKLGIPYIITTHGTYSNPHAYTGKRLWAKWLFELDYLKRATELHIITREEGTGLQKYGYTGKSFVAYNGVELSEIPDCCTADIFENKPYNNRIKIGWVGVFREDKNITSLIEAVSLLPKYLRKQFVIILIGPDYKGNANKWLSLANKLGCEDNFDWLGPLYNQDKYNAYYGFDAYVMTSFSEGFSMAILDAMACGNPCLLTKGCCMNYFNLPGKEFFVPCEPYPQDIARGIKELLDRKDEWKLMGSNARKWIEEEFNWPTITANIIENYNRIIKEKNNVE